MMDIPKHGNDGNIERFQARTIDHIFCVCHAVCQGHRPLFGSFNRIICARRPWYASPPLIQCQGFRTR